VDKKGFAATTYVSWFVKHVVQLLRTWQAAI